MLILTLSESSSQVLKRITQAITIPMTGSMKYHPVRAMTIPETTTPAETRVSAAICRKAPRVFMSFF